MSLIGSLRDEERQGRTTYLAARAAFTGGAAGAFGASAFTHVADCVVDVWLASGG